jgi:hypothetical protein
VRARHRAARHGSEGRGIQYDQRTYRRAWASLLDFLEETFADEV